MVNFRKANLPQEEFVFIYIDVFGITVASQPARPWARGDADDDLAKEAYQVCLRGDFIGEILYNVSTFNKSIKSICKVYKLL